MNTALRDHADKVEKLFSVTTYLVNYRLSSEGDGVGKGTRAERYAALCEKLKKMAGSELRNFDDGGHVSTSSWIINEPRTAKAIGESLETLLVKNHDFLAIFEIEDSNRWSMPDSDGDRAQTTAL